MAGVPAELGRRVAALAADRTSGASALLREALAILDAARGDEDRVVAVAREICHAQPSMAPVWNAAVEAVASFADPDRFERFTRRVARAPRTLGRLAADHFAAGDTPCAFVTISASSAVRAALDAVRAIRPITVRCSESRPALEGRQFAADLAAAGVPVTCFGDTALAHALAGADAVLVGADAVAAGRFLNKSGTCMLAAAAAQQGVPVYVAATRDKFAGDALAARLVPREGAPGEIWDAAPAGVVVRNPYFEWTPLEVVTAVISDLGVLGTGMVPDVCRALHDAPALAALARLGD